MKFRGQEEELVFLEDQDTSSVDTRRKVDRYIADRSKSRG